jgi:hypothetical protein
MTNNAVQLHAIAAHIANNKSDVIRFLNENNHPVPSTISLKELSKRFYAFGRSSKENALKAASLITGEKSNFDIGSAIQDVAQIFGAPDAQAQANAAMVNQLTVKEKTDKTIIIILIVIIIAVIGFLMYRKFKK